MHRGRFLFAAALMLVAAKGWGAAAPTTLISQKFDMADAATIGTGWTLKGTAALEELIGAPAPDIDVSLTQNTSGQGGVAWSTMQVTTPTSFTVWADVNVDFHPRGTGVDANCPADGFALAFADVADVTKAAALGGAGGSMGLYGASGISSLIASEANTWYGNAPGGLKDCSSGNNVTFEFTDENGAAGKTARNAGGTPDKGGAYINQTVVPPNLNGKIINGGWYRYQWDVDMTAGTMDLYISGLDASNNSVQNEKLNTVTFTANAPKFPAQGHFGIAAGTGGGTEGVHVRQLIAVTPAQAPGAPPQ